MESSWWSRGSFVKISGVFARCLRVFSLMLGSTELQVGFFKVFLMANEAHSSDKKFCLEAVDLHKETFGVIPETYGFDRGGYSQSNIEKLKKKGVIHVGVVPKGLASWEVSKTKQEQITRERA